jgi:SsrA-binding protein
MKDLAYNRRIKFDYEVKELFEAGLVLLGVEVKSVKSGNISLRGSFVAIHENDAYLTNATIPPWQPKNTPDDYDPIRSRKLLLKKSELKQLIGAKKTKGLTLVPIRVYNKGGKVKVQIALAKGKRKADKKQMKKERDILRDTERMLRGKE